VGAAARHLVILAGGSGSRIGSQKAMAPLGGRALIEYPLEAAAAAGLTPVVAAKRSTLLPDDLSARDVRVLIEPEQPRHPLQGVVAALDALAQPIVVCACDMPFVPAGLLAELAAGGGAPVVTVRVDGRLQPTLARYEPAAAEPLRDAVVHGRSARSALEDAGVVVLSDEWLARHGDPARLLADIDTREELARAEAGSADGQNSNSSSSS
jgi:molybdopterin-guanine dinucleotide biosynthesis protein A